jgi:hypothetical protein
MSVHNSDLTHDLHLIHEEKIRADLLSIHPLRWLAAGKAIGHVFEIFSDDIQWIQIDGARVNSHRELRNLKINRKPRLARNVYFASSACARRYREYVPTGAEVERAIQDYLIVNHPGSTGEWNTPAGRIDCLDSKNIIEIKTVKRWKNGLGQLLAYSAYHSTHQVILHLFGAASDVLLEEEARICESLGVLLRYQQVTGKSIFAARDVACSNVRSWRKSKLAFS